jgi:DNA replication and repair protein RecF
VTPQSAVRFTRVRIRDFRNIARADLGLDATGVALVGENGHGKTNFLEALYYLHLLRSVRGARDQDLVHFGAEAFHISASCERSGSGPREISAAFERRGKRKRVTLDGAPTERLSDGLGAVPSVFFAPADARLAAGPASERRRAAAVPRDARAAECGAACPHGA